MDIAGMTDPLFVEYKDADHMADALADHVANSLSRATRLRGKAGLIVSGGTTPKALFERLCWKPIDWDKVTITLADDRLVPKDHEHSNDNLIRTSLLQSRARSARFISLVSDAPTVEDGIPETRRQLRSFPWPADITLLGMGDDGHTASLFPGSDALSQALDLKTLDRAIVITPNPLPANAPYSRITLSLPALLDSNRIIVMIKGTQKRHIYEKALAGSDVTDMPIRAVLHQSTATTEVHWAP